jgi:toxin-antitoxin system PIN domain toxin
MTLYFPDVNVWIALFVLSHPHNELAWKWKTQLPADDRVLFSRYTQLGLLRLLTNNVVMGEQTLTLGEAWAVYDRWLEDPSVEFCPEPRHVEERFRLSTEPFASQTATKWVGDCWLLAFAQATRSRLVTFDRALCEFAQKQNHAAVRPG